MCGRSMSHYTWDCQLLALLALLASGLSILEIFNYSQCGISIPCITCIMTHYVWAHYESVYVEFSIIRIMGCSILCITHSTRITCITRIMTHYVRTHNESV